MASKIEGEAIGIDLGTTYSCVAVLQSNGITLIPDDVGETIAPSYVAFDGFEQLVGDTAKNIADKNPFYSIFDAKRLIGRRFLDPCVKEDMSLWPFKVVADFDGNPAIEVINIQTQKKKLVTPEEISSIVLKKMKKIAEDFLNRKVTHAVITVPATFNDSQRRATKNAGIIAGLKVINIINKPSAVAISCDLPQKASMTGKQRNFLFFSFGGGTCEATLLKIDSGSDEFLVQATAGDTHLGGRDIDNRLVTHMVTLFMEQHNKDISNNARALSRLRSECEIVKRTLSSKTETTIEIESFCDGKDIVAKIDRAQFEELNKDLFKKCIDLVQRCLQDSKVDKTQVDEVILFGGSSRIPKVHELLRDFFQKQLCQILQTNEIVAAGAAFYASKLKGKMYRKKNLVLVDVIPLSLGIKTRGGVMTVFLPRNTPIPTRQEMIFSTGKDNQTSAVIQVYEGECPQAKDNNILGEFELTNIPPAARGVLHITIIYEIDSNGILNVSAMVRGAGRLKIQRITNTSRLKEEIRKNNERLKAEEPDTRPKELSKEEIKKKSQGLKAEELDTTRKESEYLCNPNFDLYVYRAPEINYTIESSTPNFEDVD